MTVSFAVQKLWSLIRFHLSILAFVANAFDVLFMKSLPTPMSWMVLPRLPSRVFMVPCLMFKVFNPSGVNFSVRCQEGVQFLLSAHG